MYLFAGESGKADLRALRRLGRTEKKSRPFRTLSFLRISEATGYEPGFRQHLKKLSWLKFLCFTGSREAV